MSLLVLQIVIKQWDKSRRTDTHVLQRAAIPDAYPLIFPPAFYVFDDQCIIDQHGDDIQGGRVKYAQAANGIIKFDRFYLCPNDKVIAYHAGNAESSPRIIGSVDNQWVQCQYNCRYSIFESDRFYWLYEEVTVNAICLSEVNENVFLHAEPVIVYQDFNELDNRKKTK